MVAAYTYPATSDEEAGKVSGDLLDCWNFLPVSAARIDLIKLILLDLSYLLTVYRLSVFC
jgi:hypothetical protein